MKKLILVRHGKASKDDKYTDKQRPLKERGYTDAAIIIKALKLYLHKPVKMISSPAKRALTTAELFKDGLAVDLTDFQVVEEIYTFTSEELWYCIKDQSDADDQLLVFGHNPAITELVNQYGDRSVTNIPTTGLVEIDFEVNHWKEIDQGKTLLTLYPRTFK